MYRIKLISFVLAAVTFVAATACTMYEADQDVMTTYSFNVDVETETITKADSAPEMLADRCILEIFYNGNSVVHTVSPLINGQAQFTVQVIAGRTYDIVFWADKYACYETASLKNIQYKESGYDFADSSMDAFYKVCKNVTIGQSPEVHDVTLTRAVSMISIEASSSETVTLTAPGTFNVLEDSLSNDRMLSFTNKNLFIFAPADRQNIDITYGTKVLSSVPVQRNYKTNIKIQEE